MVGTTGAAMVEVGRGGRAVAITRAVAVDVGRGSRLLVGCWPAPAIPGAASDPLDIIGISRSATSADGHNAGNPIIADHVVTSRNRKIRTDAPN